MRYHFAISASILRIEGIGTTHLYRELGHPIWRIGPRPGCRQQPMEVDVAYTVGEELVGMTVDNHHAFESLQDRLDFLCIIRPEVPEFVELIER